MNSIGALHVVKRAVHVVYMRQNMHPYKASACMDRRACCLKRMCILLIEEQQQCMQSIRRQQSQSIGGMHGVYEAVHAV